MSVFTPKDASSGRHIAKSPAHSAFVLTRSKIIRNGTVVWLLRKHD